MKGTGKAEKSKAPDVLLPPFRRAKATGYWLALPYWEYEPRIAGALWAILYEDRLCGRSERSYIYRIAIALDDRKALEWLIRGFCVIARGLPV